MYKNMELTRVNSVNSENHDSTDSDITEEILRRHNSPYMDTDSDITEDMHHSEPRIPYVGYDTQEISSSFIHKINLKLVSLKARMGYLVNSLYVDNVDELVNQAKKFNLCILTHDDHMMFVSNNPRPELENVVLFEVLTYQDEKPYPGTIDRQRVSFLANGQKLYSYIVSKVDIEFTLEKLRLFRQSIPLVNFSFVIESLKNLHYDRSRTNWDYCSAGADRCLLRCLE